MSYLRSLLTRAQSVAGVSTPSRDVENAQLLPVGADKNFVIHLLALADSARRNGEANFESPFFTFREADSLMVGIMTMRNLFIAFEGRTANHSGRTSANRGSMSDFAEKLRADLRTMIDALREDEAATRLKTSPEFLDGVRYLAELVERTFPIARVGELRVALMTTSFTYKVSGGYGWDYADCAKR